MLFFDGLGLGKNLGELPRASLIPFRCGVKQIQGLLISRDISSSRDQPETLQASYLIASFQGIYCLGWTLQSFISLELLLDERPGLAQPRRTTD